MLTAPSPHDANHVQADLKAFKIEHKWDPNLPQESIAVVDDALRGEDFGEEGCR